MNNGDPEKLATFHQAQTERERYRAKLARLDYERKVGRLVEVEQVEKQAFRVARLVRDGLLNLPDRLAGVLAAEGDQGKVHAMLSKEIRTALEELKV